MNKVVARTPEESMSISGLTSPNIQLDDGDDTNNNNSHDAFVIGVSLTAIIIVLVVLRFVINIVIDVIILRDMNAAVTRCQNYRHNVVVSASTRCWIWFAQYFCCGRCARNCSHHDTIPSSSLPETNQNTATVVDDDDDDDDDSSSSGRSSNSDGSYTPTLEFSLTLQQLQLHQQQQQQQAVPHSGAEKMNSGDTNSSSCRSSSSGSGGSRSHTNSSSTSSSGSHNMFHHYSYQNPDTILIPLMETLLPSTIVTRDWMTSQTGSMTHLEHIDSGGGGGVDGTHSILNDIPDETTTTILTTAMTNDPIPVFSSNHDNYYPIDTESMGHPQQDTVGTVTSPLPATMEGGENTTTSSPPPPLSVIVDMDPDETVPSDRIHHHHQDPHFGDEEDGMAVSSLFSQLPTCSICLQVLSTGQSIYTVETCLHYFHSTCLQEWLLQPVVVAQRHRRRRRRRQSPSHQHRRPSRRLLQSCTVNNLCPNCRTPIIVPASKFEDVVHYVLTQPESPTSSPPV